MNPHALADRVLSGGAVTRAEARALLDVPDDDLLDLLAASGRIRRRHFGRVVRVHVLRNAKSGVCVEDCGFCSQSLKFQDTSPVPRYGMQSADELVAGARQAVQMGAVTYCMVTATRGPNKPEMGAVCEAARRIKADFPQLQLCASLGLLKEGQAEVLREAGIDRYNHNLETSPQHFANLVSTHTIHDRVRTVKRARSAGMEACCGGIVGMGEQLDDRVELAFALAELQVESVPVNFLDPRPGTPLCDQERMRPQEALRSLAMFRFVLPTVDLRVAGGREVVLGSLQPLALWVANSLFTNGYLTTGGAGPSGDAKMIADAGFVPEVLAAHGQQEASAQGAP